MEGAEAPAVQPLPGWYPDPERPSGSRYWDGTGWTPQRAKQVQPRNLGTRAVWVYIALGLTVLASVAYGIASLDYADAVQTQADERSLTFDEATDAEDPFFATGLFWLLAHIGAAIAFLFWFHAAYSNLRGLTGRQLRYGSGWSIGSWLIPIFNLWRPKQIANDVWRGGDQASWGNAGWPSLPVSALVHWWWAIYLLAGVIGGIGSNLLSVDPVLSDSAGGAFVTDSDLDQEHSAAIAIAISNAIDIAAAALAVLFVKRATDRQHVRIANPSGAHQPDA